MPFTKSRPIFDPSVVDLSTVKTLTVDVFDTILLRDTWPEDEQFLQVAEDWKPLLGSLIDPSITVYEALTFRNYARRILLAATRDTPDSLAGEGDPEIEVRSWFRFMVELLADKYGKDLDQNRLDEAVSDLIAAELETEERHLWPNHELAEEIRQLRSERGIKVYFVSDMYLSAEHIGVLLKAAGLDDIFDGGITSADARRGKHTGAMFRYLDTSGVFPAFDLHHNLHIGDNRRADYQAPVTEGSKAILYHTAHHTKRAAQERLGAMRMVKYHQRQRLAIRAEVLGDTPELDLGRAIGLSFAAPLTAYVHEISRRASLNPRTHFLGVSSEAVVFEQAHQLLFDHSPANLAYAPAINRKASMKAVLPRIVELGHEHSQTLQGIISYGEKTSSRAEMMEFIGAPAGELFLESMSQKAWDRYFWDFAEKKYSGGDQTEVLETMGFDSYDRVTLLDVGWGGTIQVFIRELASLVGYQGDIGGLYVGVQSKANRFGVDRGQMEGLLLGDVHSWKSETLWVPEIWEYVLSDKAQYNVAARHRAIHHWVLEGTSTWRRALHCSPDDFWEAMRPELVRLLGSPTRSEVEYLGTIKFDSGFNKVEYVPLVNTGRHPAKLLVLSMLRPKQVLRQLVAQYSWSRGAIRYYHLPHMRPLVRLVGLRRRRGRA